MTNDYKSDLILNSLIKITLSDEKQSRKINKYRKVTKNDIQQSEWKKMPLDEKVTEKYWKWQQMKER